MYEDRPYSELIRNRRDTYNDLRSIEKEIEDLQEKLNYARAEYSRRAIDWYKLDAEIKRRNKEE